MTLNALKFERKEEKKHHPRVLFRIVEVDSDEQPRLPAGHRCEGPTPRATRGLLSLVISFAEMVM